MAYRVAIAGMGKRGGHHAAAFAQNGRFQVVAVCDPVQASLDKASAEVKDAKRFASAEEMLREVKPDLFCFCTHPNLRLPMIEMGIKSGARMIAYEKPIALSMNEAIEIRSAVQAAGVKTVVSHQHRYGEHYRKVREIVAAGGIGKVNRVYGTAVGWMMHMATHMVDLMRWYNGNAEAEWVMAQAAGRGKLGDIHPSPDYLAGVIQFANGVRGYVETGAGAPDLPEVEYWWHKNRVGAQGDGGFAEALTGGGWRAVTKDGLSSGPGKMAYAADMAPYVDEMADWLDDDRKIHQCNGESAHKGFEIVMALVRSVVHGGQIALPLAAGDPELEALKKAVADRPVILSTEASRKEYSA